MPLDIDRIHKPVRKLRKFLKKMPKRPAPEEIHTLRTNTRRFEATIEALGLDSKANERRLLRDLARVRKRAGKIRDMDVLTGFATKLATKLNVPGEQDCLVQLVEQLGADRSKHVKKLRAVVQDYRSPLRRRLKRASAHLENVVDQNGKNGKNQPAVAPSELVSKAIEFAQELKTPPRLDKKNLHPYRLKVKALRNVLQLSEQADQQKFVDKLGEVKDAIGEWHDWQELIAIATDTLDHGPECKLIKKLQEISDKKYEQALALTNQMRETCLEAKNSKSRKTRTKSKQGTLRPATMPSLPRPVLAAASAIAS